MALSEVDDAEADEDCGAVADVGDNWACRSLVALVLRAAGATPFEVALELLVAAGGGLRVVFEELACAVRLWLLDLRVEPTSLLKRELKVDDIG